MSITIEIIFLPYDSGKHELVGVGYRGDRLRAAGFSYRDFPALSDEIDVRSAAAD